MKVPFKTTVSIIATVKDIDGHTFWCTEARETEHGFYVWLGKRAEYRQGASTVVLTREIAEHMKKHNFSYQSARLPFADKVCRRFRKRMGVLHPNDKISRRRKKATTPPPVIIEDFQQQKYKVTWQQECELGIIIYRGTLLDIDFPSPQYVLTTELAEIIKGWADYPIKLAKILPFNIATLSMLRRKLDVKWHDDRLLWWSERIDDLIKLPTKDFVSKHGQKARTVCDIRAAVGYVSARSEEPERHAEFFNYMKADWSDKKQDVLHNLGSKYSGYRRYRKAYKILRLAGRINRLH